MAGGPIHPNKAFPVTANVAFTSVYDGAGSTEDREEGLFLADATTVTGDVTVWHLVFKMPESLPSGTATLQVRARANATTGVIGLNVSWVSVSGSESPDDATMNDEGSLDISYPSTADQYVTATLTLDADTVVAGEIIRMNIDVDDSAHTIAADSMLDFTIIWT